MLDKQDIVILQKMFDQNGQDIKAEIRYEIRSSIAASEKRMMAYWNEVKSDITATVKQHLKLA